MNAAVGMVIRAVRESIVMVQGEGSDELRAARPRPAERAEVIDPRTLHRDHLRDVHRWVRQLLGPSPDVDDLVQEVFVAAVKNLGSYRGDAKLETWLFAIVRNVVRAHRRRARVRALIFGEAVELETVASKGETPAEEVLRRERERTLYRVLDRLKERERTLLVLFELEGCSGRELAERLEMSEASVWVALHRARKAFVAEMTKLERSGAR